MTTPLIWIFLPAGAALLLFLLHAKNKLSSILGGSIALLLFIAARTMPPNLIITIG